MSEIILASDTFDPQAMYTDLMIYGVYVYHEPLMKGLVDFSLTNWDFIQNPDYGISSCHNAAYIFRNIQMDQVFPLFPELEPMEPFVYYGIDEGAEKWHNDARERLGIQFLCYQEDFEPNDGGSLRIKCYDGVERWYYPKNGDVVITNHHTDIAHMVEAIYSNKKRIAINFKLKRP